MNFKPSDIRDKIKVVRESQTLKGLEVGFRCFDDLFTLKKGYPVYIAGAPHHGKTEFTLEILVSMSEKYGWKHCVYLGETGDPEEIHAELAHKYIGKPFRKYLSKNVENKYAMSDSDMYKAEQFIEEHFTFIAPEIGFSLEEFYVLVDKAEQEREIKFDTTVIDPFNDLNYDLMKHGGRQDLQLEADLLLCKTNARNNKRVNILVNHISSIQPIRNEDGNSYIPPALPSQWAGGQVWHRRGFLMILVWRPPVFYMEDGMPVEENETYIFTQKVKPKGIGSVGKKSLFWDWQKSRYYEDLEGFKRYAFGTKFEEQEVKTLEPNTDFENDLPF